MNPDLLIDGLLRGVMDRKGRKRSKKALRYLTGSRAGFFTNPTTLLTAAGVAWGIYETLNQQQGASGPQGAQGAQGAQNTRGAHGVPSSGEGLHGAGGQAPPVPPLPNVGAAATVAPDVLRLVRLAISAAHADGTVSETERAEIAARVGESGGADLVAEELAQPRPLAEIVGGVTDRAQCATLYVLAYAIVRADDERISGTERIYLAQLANHLGLTPRDVETLEKGAAARIDAADPSSDT